MSHFGRRERRAVMAAVVWVASLALAGATAAQTPLSLDEAMRRAQQTDTAVRAAAAARAVTTHQVTRAAAGQLPSLDVAQTWQRGDQPVFVFGSLLSQRRFTAADFALPSLNHPSAIDNHRSSVTAQYRLFDGGEAREAVRSARLADEMAGHGQVKARQDVALGAAVAYTRVAHVAALEQARERAVAAAEADARRATARRDAGVATDADALASAVALASARAALLDVQGELAVARATLNDAIGAPLDAVFEVRLPAEPPAADVDLAAAERDALTRRPEMSQAALRAAQASAETARARAAFLPRVGVQGGMEFNGDTPWRQTASWVVGVDVRLNLFRGFADQAQVAASRAAEAQAAFERDGTARALRLDVRAAGARLEAARRKAEVGQQALTQALEAQRILRNRYENGRATIGDVLDAARMVASAEADALAARADVVVGGLALAHARGTLLAEGESK